LEHNQVLQQNGLFTAADLEANKEGRYSPAQLKRFEETRNFMQYSASKYDNKGPVISLIFGFGFLIFAVVLYFVGVFDMLRNALGSLFFPVMIGALIFAALFIFVIVPRQYQASVEMARSMGTPLAASPLGEIQTIEARAEAYTSQGGINRRGHQSARVSHVLQMDSIKFNITDSLREVIQSKRLYRVYCVKDQGVWTLLSMETLE
ncbi:MAG: hypothetical protein IH588_06885, partial [Anaerolineales bacterium]|nr:hypothetical protein [Anaerolineales bacterium]